jgi:hypothetical protein
MEEILEELRQRYYYTSQKFGGPEAMIRQISLADDDFSTTFKISRLLSHSGEIKVISPWDFLFEMKGASEEDSIIPSHGYKINDIDGRLLYRVTKHGAIWGESLLDKALVLQSMTGYMFYLTYTTFQGIQQSLLIINNLALRLSNPISDDDAIRVPAPPSIEPSNNYINIECSQVLLNGPSSITITTLFLKSVGHTPPTLEYVSSNPLTIKEEHYLSSDDSLFIYFPKESGWFFIQLNNQTPLELINLIGAGDDRFIQANEYLFYIALGEELNTSLLRQSMGLINRRPAAFSRDNIIRLTLEASNG